MRHDSDISIACSRCGTSGSEHWCARITSRGLRVSNGFWCHACGTGYEADGNEIPDDVRQAFIAVEGLWTLAVVELGTTPLGPIRIVRERTSTSLRDALGIVRQREIIARATLAEIEQLQMLLEREGARVLVQRSS